MYISILLFLEIYTYNLKQTHPHYAHKMDIKILLCLYFYLA